VLRAEWALIAVARSLYTIFGYPQANDVFLCRCRSPVSEAEIVFLASALVTMPFNRDADFAMQVEEFGICWQSFLCIRTNVRLVVVEKRVFDGLWLAKTLLGFEIKNLRRVVALRLYVTSEPCSKS
jgi:hypothetical protein